MEAARGFALADSAALLRALPSPVVLVYMDGSLEMNAAARARLAQLATVQDWPELFHPHSVPHLQAALREAFQGQTGHVSVRLADSAQPGLVTVAPGGPGSALLHLHSAGHPLEVALGLMDELCLGLTIQAQDSQILYANRCAQDILGLSWEQLAGRDSLDPRWRAIHPNGAAFPGDTHPAMQALRSGESVRDVPMGVFHPPSETWRWLSVTAMPRRIPGEARPHQVTTVFEDVTELYQAQAALQQSERRFRSLVEATAQIVWTADPDGFFSPPQPGWEAFTGQRPAEYEGQGWLSALHPDDRAHTLAAWNAAVRSSTPYMTRQRLRRESGEYVAMQVRAVPVLDDQGAVHEWVGVHHDVRATQAAEQALRQLNTALEARVQEHSVRLAEATRLNTLLLSAAGEGVLGLDAGGRITFANPEAERLLGRSAQSMVGADHHALLHHHHADGRVYGLDACPIHRTLQDGEKRQIEADVFWQTQGHPLPVAYTVTPATDQGGRVTGAVIMVRDLTERLEAQRALQVTIDRMEHSDHSLKEFACRAGDDLQEPLRTLESGVNLLTRPSRAPLQGQVDQALRLLQGAVGRLHDLSRDLQSFAAASQDEGAPRSLSMDLLMRATAQNVQATVQERGGTLVWDTPHHVLGHGSPLTRLLTELIGTALTWMPSGRPPEVRVGSRVVGELLQISVQDNGSGIVPQDVEGTFASSQRPHQHGTHAGNGMGLAICHRIVEHHGGRLWVEAVPGQGNTFHFTLPVGSPPPRHD